MQQDNEEFYSYTMRCPHCMERVEVIDIAMAKFYACPPCRGKILGNTNPTEISQIREYRKTVTHILGSGWGRKNFGNVVDKPV